jgi:hypothetical protein
MTLFGRCAPVRVLSLGRALFAPLPVSRILCGRPLPEPGRARHAGDVVSRDNLDENGGGNLEIEAAAGSGAMIIWCSKLRKHFFSTSLVDCR